MAKTYEAMQKVGSNPSGGWRIFDLKNRKQTGDLEKKILQIKQKNNFKVFNFSSARGKEGVSTILANLVDYLKIQDSGKKVLVIDANFKYPILHKIFNTDNNRPGLSDVLANGKSLNEALITLDSTNITLLTYGQGIVNQAENLNQEKFTALINTCKEEYDYVLIDSAPLLTSSDALSIALSSDVTFLVVLSTAVQKEVALKATSILLDNECAIGGVILNRIKQVIPGWIYRLT